MKSIFKFSTIILALVLMIIPISNAFASDTTTNVSCLEQTFNINDALNQSSNLISSDSGNKVIDVTNYVFSMDGNIAQSGFVGAAVSFMPKTDVTVNPVGISPFLFTSYYLKNKTYGNACGSQIYRQSTFSGPANATISITQSISSGYSTSVGISKSTLEAELGYSLNVSTTFTDVYSVYVPSGKIYTVYCRPFYNVTNFEVWANPLFGANYYAGSGYSTKPVGFCFYFYSN